MCSPSSEPLPVHSAHILDYKESPETGVVFDIEPPAETIFSRVNISYMEGEERRSMLYKGRHRFCLRTSQGSTQTGAGKGTHSDL